VKAPDHYDTLHFVDLHSNFLRSNDMSPEPEILALRAQVAELESRVDFLYNHLGIAQVQNMGMVDARVIDMLKKRNKIEAIKIYRELYNCGLAEAKQAVENIESRLGL
jgi:ribosomal protein L7/L12